MTLLVTVFAAVAATLFWYARLGKADYRLGVLALMYWGAALMWLVDAVFAYVEQQAAYFTPAPYEMLNDLFLGLSVVALGLVIWLIVLFISDPEGKLRHYLRERGKEERQEETGYEK